MNAAVLAEWFCYFLNSLRSVAACKHESGMYHSFFSYLTIFCYFTSPGFPFTNNYINLISGKHGILLLFVVRCYIWMIALYGLGTWKLIKLEWKYLEMHPVSPDI